MKRTRTKEGVFSEINGNIVFNYENGVNNDARALLTHPDVVLKEIENKKVRVTVTVETIDD